MDWLPRNSPPLTILYTAPVVALTGASTTTVGTPYTINFGATSPVPDPITQWVVNWGDGTSNPDLQTFGAGTNSATHIFTSPATPDNIQVFAYDTEAPTSPVSSPVLPVTVTVNPASVSAGGPYTIPEGSTLNLAALAPGAPTSFSWTINGHTTISGQDPSLAWSTLEGFGINNVGTYQATVDVFYGGTDVISTPDNIVVTDVPPSDDFINSGPDR